MKKFIAIQFILFSLQLSAQVEREKIRVGVFSGYSIYWQKDLKEINQNVIEQLLFKAAIIDNFAPVFYFGGHSQYLLFNRLYLGPSYEYHFTGSRLGAKDYSGFFYFDQYVNCHLVGLKSDYQLFFFNRTGLGFELNAGAGITDWKMDTKLELGKNGELTEQKTDKMKGLSWYISPAIRFEYKFMQKVNLVGAISDSFDLFRKYSFVENKDLKVINTPNWSGLKLSLGLDLNL